MKCPKCDREVPPGFLFCPHCLAEIPWVKEFDTVETRLEKKRLEEKDLPPEDDIDILPDRPIRVRKERESLPKWLFSGRRLVLLWLAAAGALLLLIYVQTHSFEAYYRKAVESMNAKDYDQALANIELAAEKRPDDLNTNLMMADILEQEGKPDEAVLVLKPLVASYPDNVDICMEMCRLLTIQERYAELKDFLRGIRSEKVREACSDFIVEPPRTSLPEGTYAGEQTVSLFTEGQKTFYTVNGDDPDTKSTYYENPIILKEGTTEVKAVSVNALNIPSEIMCWTYVISVDVPDAPEITPHSGAFYESTRIEIAVPDGCRAYYAFDEMPTTESTEYMSPIQMPSGAHVFYAILVSASGNVSEVTTRDYYLEY